MIEPRADATLIQIDHAANAAAEAFETYAAQSPEQIAKFLERIASGIEALGDLLLQTAAAESALSIDRLTGERGRTVNQLRMFAGMVRNGAWKDVRVDAAMPDRKPLRRPDLRRVLVPLGPVAVWAACNPSHTRQRIPSAQATGIRSPRALFRSMSRARSEPSTYSMAMK